MPIKSYLAHPHTGRKEHLIAALSILECCDVIPAENENLLIVVTDTDTQEQEDHLKEKIEAIDSLKLLAMVSGFDTPKQN
jgi:nitrate reductase NapAB chaperone NapD